MWNEKTMGAIRWLGLAAVTVVLFATPVRAVEFPGNIDHAPWQALLERYVDDRGLIDYAAWGASAEALEALDHYLAAYGTEAKTPATGADRRAGLINLYNALTVREVIRREPKASFWDTEPFDDNSHRVGGEKVSLNEIEHQAARPEIGYRVHAALVCAARSCPALPRRAFTADDLEPMLDGCMRRWLRDDRLNRFDPRERVLYLSKIFEWFEQDFADPGVVEIWERYGPERSRGELGKQPFTIEYLPYDTSLNAR